jgi:hypothetical protein
MRSLVLSAILTMAVCAPALADSYPVSGRWGESTSSQKGPIDCTGKRVIAFSGNQRTDSNGGVPAYRNRSVTRGGSSRYRIVDIFTTGQISSGHTAYTLQRIDADHIEIQFEQGGTINLRRCK